MTKRRVPTVAALFVLLTTGCGSVSNQVIVRNVAVIDRELHIEKCILKSSNDELVIEQCRVERQPLPALLDPETCAETPSNSTSATSQQ
jgi:hypothetical protein